MKVPGGIGRAASARHPGGGRRGRPGAPGRGGVRSPPNRASATLMWHAVGLFRERDGLRHAVAALDEADRRLQQRLDAGQVVDRGRLEVRQPGHGGAADRAGGAAARGEPRRALPDRCSRPATITGWSGPCI